MPAFRPCYSRVIAALCRATVAFPLRAITPVLPQYNDLNRRFKPLCGSLRRRGFRLA